MDVNRVALGGKGKYGKDGNKGKFDKGKGKNKGKSKGGKDFGETKSKFEEKEKASPSPKTLAKAKDCASGAATLENMVISVKAH